MSQVNKFRKFHINNALSRVWQHLKLSDVSLGVRPQYSLVVDEDVKEPNKQTNKLLRHAPSSGYAVLMLFKITLLLMSIHLIT